MNKAKEILKLILKCIVFLAGLAVLLVLCMSVLSFKHEDGSLPMRNYYDLPGDTVDVLMVGSSHIGMNVNTKQLWDEYGIAAYKCWGSTQPIWNSYYYLNECLKTQTPKVIVVDVHGATFSYEYSDYVLQTKNLMGMKFSANKIEAVKTSAPKESWADLLLELPAYHYRYGELTEQDFEYFPWNHHPEMKELSNASMDIVYPFQMIDISKTEGIEPLEEKEERYLRKIIDLCNERGIPLELVVAPYQLSEGELKRYRAAAEIAEEYSTVHFTDFNETYMDYGISTAKDYVDPGHLNKTGVPKYTRAIADILMKYQLPDRRTDPNHIWNLTKEKEAVPVYSLEYQFEGDGIQRYLDTGVRLYENPLNTWTLLTEFEVPSYDDENGVVLACYDETEDNYHGLLIRTNENHHLIIAFSSYANFDAGEVREGQVIRLGVIKNHDSIEVFLNGKRLNGTKLGGFSGYEGTLLLAAQVQPDGKLFRFSMPIIHDLIVYDSCLKADEASLWHARILPEEKIETVSNGADSDEGRLFRLTETYRGDGIEKYVNTGIRLFEDPEDSWTVLARISPKIESGDTVYFSDFLEDPKHYTGLLVRRVEDGLLNIMYGGGLGVNIGIPEDKDSVIAVVKKQSAYEIYLNGKCVMDWNESFADPYEGELYIGCQIDSRGEKFRYSGTTVYNLEVADEALGPEEIAAWDPEPLKEAKKKKGSSVSYTLEAGFAGNGKDRALDTGVRLYDVPDKDWSMHFLIDLSEGSSGTIASCFAEEPDHYRGFAFRMTDPDTYGLILGSEYVSITSNPGRTMVVDIIKQEFTYRVYVDGVFVQEVSGRCSAYNGSLLLCAERMDNGSLFRFSNQKIRKLNIVSNALSEEELKEAYGSDTNYR